MNFQRYLSAKRTADGRALNRRVEERLGDAVCMQDRLRVLEVGAGIGSTVLRLLDRQWLPDRVTYTALDVDERTVVTARERLPPRAAALGYAVRRAGDRFVLSREGRRVEVEFRTADAFEFLAETDAVWDLVVAQAFADLVDPADALAAFRTALAPEGLVYCPITFDGETIFEPVTDAEFEGRLLDAFHRHLDRSGDSRAGRHLLSLAAAGDEGGVLAAGGSDWVVRPRGETYPADETYFLDCIVEMVESAVRAESVLDDRRLSAWVARRHRQVEDAELVYVAHQLDLLIR
ncbi:bifunctional 2-polyprenyl-6-hydroxyphenol methylase/3-demethylubiquinol 3-O-methyltransferase UbiG [Halorussus sp. MSC15.2]|uniref:class I SAM-dependent methyltransferase n=1 Tax=Halorussus sp. MSC15.2 TaxID=2283638 RepID=UPI0013D0DA46|nr:class I SAM-dependent methyltransferase [Halorussus sp. MSC15.2]NEU57821.1 class I SAM-dependent methyltransferase [Halorussus sp. MSC15.2]